MAMASASKTVDEIAVRRRFILGIGVSHKPVVANRGHTYDKPYGYMKGYLPQLNEALKRKGQTKRQIPLLVAALHPKCLRWRRRHRPMAHIPILYRLNIPPRSGHKSVRHLGSASNRL
jgi:alkanesulfonate monooxygenase SsuD/methylene tetrahydromethanopterin reductase-like flavin-dependent oxidoreductase (luciferase family)